MCCRAKKEHAASNLTVVLRSAAKQKFPSGFKGFAYFCPSKEGKNLSKEKRKSNSSAATQEQRKISIKDENIIFLLARNNYKKEIKREFPNSKLIRWKDFRMNY